MPATLALYIPTARDLRAMPFSPDGDHWAILDVRGSRADLRMFLPTGPLANLEGAYWVDWIVALHGASLARTDASAAQRDALLDIVYAFNIFSDGHREVDPDHYSVFIAKIVEVATSDPTSAPVNDKLGEIAALARKLIPPTVWNVYVLPSPPDYPAQLFGFPSPQESDEWARAFINTWHEARTRLFRSPAHAIASTERALPFAPTPLPFPAALTRSTAPARLSPSSAHTPATRVASDSESIPPLESQSCPSSESDCDSIPPLESCPASESDYDSISPLESRPASESGDRSDSANRAHAGLSPTRDVMHSGYESDDSIPSLRTVDDSSDSDFEDGRVERALELRDYLDRFLVAHDYEGV